MTTTLSMEKRVPHQVVLQNMTCGFCDRMLWDCACPQNVSCAHCEVEPENVGETCGHSEDGKHLWKGDVGEDCETIQEIES